MKIISKEEQDAQQATTVKGGLTGLAGSMAITLPAAFYANRRFHYYRSLPISLKAFSVILFVVPSFVIGAERAGQKREREHWTGAGKEELDAQTARAEERWNSLSLSQKIKETADNHQYGIILGGWAASMVGAFGMIMGNKYQSMPQKIVQARMWAQGLTIGVLIAAGAMTHANRVKTQEEGPVRHIAPDHSWRDIVEHEQAAEMAAAAKARVQQASSIPHPASH